jgi:putative hydrolase
MANIPDPNPEPNDLPPDPFGPGDPFDTSPISNASAAPGGDSGPDFSALGPLGAMFGPMLGDLTRLMNEQRATVWDQGRQVALLRAAGDGDVPVAPLDRIKLEELAVIVQRHVEEASGLRVSQSENVTVHALSRVQWTADFLELHRPMLEPATAAQPANAADPTLPADSGGDSNPDKMLAGLVSFIGPAMIAMQIGTMAGQLSHRTFGSGDLPLPRRHPDHVTLLPQNIERFATEWSLPIDSVRVRVLIEELLMHTVLRHAHVADALRVLMAEHARGFSVDTDQLMGHLEGFGNGVDPADPTAGVSPAGLGAPASARQTELAVDIARIVAVIEGYVEHLGGVIAARLLGGDRRVDEALRRSRRQTDDATELLSSLVGMRVTQSAADRGLTFAEGVVERAGTQALAALWTSTSNLPTDSELDAPGLWLARLELGAGS